MLLMEILLRYLPILLVTCVNLRYFGHKRVQRIARTLLLWRILLLWLVVAASHEVLAFLGLRVVLLDRGLVMRE